MGQGLSVGIWGPCVSGWGIKVERLALNEICQAGELGPECVYLLNVCIWGMGG